MIAGSLIRDARERLGDDKKQRWTDTRMLKIVSQGQANLCKLSGIYRKEAYIALANEQIRYRMPKDCMTIRRLEFRGVDVPLFNRNDIDDKKQITTDFVGIKDNIAMGLIDIYPALETLETDVVIIGGDNTDETFEVIPVYGVVTDIEEADLSLQPVYGVVTGVGIALDPLEPPEFFGEVCHSPEHPAPTIETPNGAYGVTIGVSYDLSTDSNLFGGIIDSEVYQIVGQYGITSSISLEDNTLRVFYEAIPEALTSLQTALVVPDVWEEAMMKYIVGTALQDDNDANNIQRGEMELQKYVAEALKARELSSKDFSGGAKDKYRTGYRRI